MKNLNFFAFLAALLLSMPLHGQNHPACSTPTPKFALQFDPQVGENLSANPFVVQIFVHILRNDDGTNAAMSDADLQTNLDRMSDFFRPHNICFTFVGRDFIDNTTWNTAYMTSMIGALHAVNPHTDALDLYIHRNTFQNSGGNAYNIPSDKCSIAASTPFNFEHEVGHCLGLLHTFETFSGTLVECPDGSNCASNGDMICDTNADFGGSENSGASCAYTGTQTINCNGNTVGYNPPTANIMSYWASCYAEFTNDQGTRMRNTINSTAFLQARLTPDDRIIAGVTLTSEIAVGAQKTIQIGNIATLGDVTMNGAAQGIFNAGSLIKLVTNTRIAPTGANGILLTINTLCDGLFFTGNVPNADRDTPARPVLLSEKMEAYPNPFSDIISVRIQLGKPTAATLQLFDFAGRQLQSIDCQSLAEHGAFSDELTLPELKPGVYFLRLQYATGQQTAKLVKVD
ncbi:MAG: zinc-dependent metalloprotease [Saprospiraceae bacterium]|nr:zinc-dependent metalloprotease [Saprospiraceae bacterium]